jgi:signal transduction histidine kinase
MTEDYASQLDETGLEYLNYIRRNALKMGDLIQDLLELSRIGRVESPHEAVEMRQLVQEALNQIQPQIEAAHIHVYIQPDLPIVRCGKSRIVQIFVNLLTNAVKYMGKNPSPQIKIGWQDRGEFYEFFVADNGIGIDPQYHEKIFEVFQTLRELEGVEGTGVGLTIVKRIIEYHKGVVWVTSQKGKGSTFHFTLPKMWVIGE